MEYGFSANNNQNFYHGLETVASVNPRLVYLSPSSNADIDDHVLSEFVYKVAEYQMGRQEHFVFAYPWYSDIWNNEWMEALTNLTSVNYQRVDLSSYSNSKWSKYDSTICLVHNLPRNSLVPLEKGPYTHKGKSVEKSSDESTALYDHYPVCFCDSAFTYIADAIKTQKGTSGMWPKASPFHVNFIDDVLEDLDLTELKCLNKVQLEDCLPGCGYQSFNVHQVPKLPHLLVTNGEIKWFMNWLNSRSRQTTIDFSMNENQHIQACVIIKVLRECCLT